MRDFLKRLGKRLEIIITGHDSAAEWDAMMAAILRDTERETRAYFARRGEPHRLIQRNP